MIKPIALFVTLTAAAMASVAAWDRGGTGIDKGLLVAMCVVIVLAVHLIPALSRRPIAWAVWTGCLLCAIASDCYPPPLSRRGCPSRVPSTEGEKS